MKKVRCNGQDIEFSKFVSSLILIALSPFVFIVLAHVLANYLDKF